jgi:hypothetical protein
MLKLLCIELTNINVKIDDINAFLMFNIKIAITNTLFEYGNFKEYLNDFIIADDLTISFPNIPSELENIISDDICQFISSNSRPYEDFKIKCYN